MIDDDRLPDQIHTEGNFSPGYVGGNYIYRGNRKPRSAPPFILPQQKTTEFVGRSDEIERLEMSLLQPESHKMAGIVGVAGTGGIGKSALACFFAEKHRDKFPDGVIGIRLDSKKDVDTIAREFARLDGEILDEDDTRNASAIMQDLFATKQILLIIDNAETANIRDLHPGGDKCTIIVTTRDRTLPGQISIPDAQIIDLPVLPDPEALSLLTQFIEAKEIEAETPAINQILALVGNLPLALEIVGKTLRNRLKLDPQFRIAKYAEALNLDRLKLKRDQHFNVRLCFERSIAYLKEDNREDLIDAFAQVSVCASSGFALETAMAAIGADDEFAVSELLYELVDLSLLNKVQTDTQRFIFHPLLQEFAGDLSEVRSLYVQAKNNHKTYFVNRVCGGNLEELEDDLDDIINVAEWMAETSDSEYVNYWLNLRNFFTRFGHWQRANKIIDVFLKLSEQNKNWIALAQFHIQQAKFILLQGDLDSSQEFLEDAESIIENIGDPLVQQRVEAQRLNSLGGVYQRQGKFEEAVGAFQQSALIGKNIRDERHLAMVLNSLGGVYQRQGKFEEAVEVFQQSLKIREDLNIPIDIAVVLNSLGGVYQRQGKFEEAVEAFQQSALIGRNIGDDRHLAMVLNSLGGVYQRQGKFEEAVEAFQQSYAISFKLEDELSKAMVLNSLGGVYQRQGKFEEAVEAFQQSYDLPNELGDDRGLAMVLNSLGGVYQRQGKFKEAVEAFRESLKIEKKLGNQRGEAMVLNSLGGVYQRQGKFEEAVEAFQQSYDLFVKLEDERGQAMVLNSLGGVYQRQGKFEEAVEAFQQSYDLSNELGDDRGLAMVLNSLGGVYQRQGKFKEAMEAFQQSYGLLAKLEDKRGQAMVLTSLGGVYQRWEEFEEAAKAFRESLQIEKILGNQRGQAMVLTSLGGVYKRQGKLEEAAKAFRESLQIEKILGNQRGQAMVLNSLGGVYQKQRKFEEAVEVIRQSHAILLEQGDIRGQAMVLTNWGKALANYGKTDEAIEKLMKGFSVDARLKNKRGLEIVTPILCRTLKSIGKADNAIQLMNQALEIAPRNRRLLQLKQELLPGNETQAKSSIVKKGKVKRILKKESGFRYGFIEPDDGSADIYFGESQVDAKLLTTLKPGMVVLADIIIEPKGPKAQRIWVEKNSPAN